MAKKRNKKSLAASTTSSTVVPFRTAPPAAPTAPTTPAATTTYKYVRPTITEYKFSDEQKARAARYEGSVLMTFMDVMLGMKRPHDGANERNALGVILRSIPDHAQWTFDEAGNLHIDCRADASNRTLFTAHVDTVHGVDGPNKIRKTESAWFADGSQLGADDGTGISLLMHMMLTGVKAYYLFTVGEECGGIGASHVGQHNTALLSEFDRAIAFDRRGSSDVITHQSGGRCASDIFAEALSDALNDHGMLYMPCDGGVYTDTAEFTDTIAECTNISCGYAREHSQEEAQDIGHLQALADAVVAIDWDALPTHRTPGTGGYDYDDAFAWPNRKWGGFPSTPAANSGGSTGGTVPKAVGMHKADALAALTDAMTHDKYEPLAKLLTMATMPEEMDLGHRYMIRLLSAAPKLSLRSTHTSILSGFDVQSELIDLCDELEEIWDHSYGPDDDDASVMYSM